MNLSPVSSFPTPAQAAFNLLHSRKPLSALALIAPLAEAGLLDKNSPVMAKIRVPISGSLGMRQEKVTLPLSEALRQTVKPGEAVSEFRTPEVAQGLLRFDPDFFSPADRPCWLWHHLEEWGKRDLDRDGYFDRGNSDQWAALIVRHLPERAFEEAAAAKALEALIRLEFPQATAALLKRNPALWGAQDEKGALTVAKAKNAWLLAVVRDAANGTDPWTIMHDGRPLWRCLAPKSPTSIPATNSLTEAVELWAAGPADEGNPERRAALDEFLRKGLAARMGHRDWSTYERKDRLAYLDRLPNQWVADGWPKSRRELPLWAIPFGHQTLEKNKNGSSGYVSEAKFWARTLEDRPAWRATIGPLADLAVWLVKNAGRAGDVPDCPDDVIQAARHPHARALLQGLCEAMPKSFANAGTMQAMGEAVLLQAELPASAPDARRPRMRF